MARRVRRETPPGEFEDPLKDYSPPQYDDELERALIETHVTAMQTQPITAMGPGTTIEQAMRTMAEREIACVLVTEGDRLLGLFSERDVLNKVADRFEQIKNHSVTEVMTPEPMVVHDIDSPATALNLMAVHGFRHVPILNVDEKLVGIVGPRRVSNYLQAHFAK
ncbi:MAG: CBS domain-containing protein [Phycisphaeraceae bacterium]